MKTEETQQIDVAGNWTNLLFLERLITGVIFSETAPVQLHGLATGQTKREKLKRVKTCERDDNNTIASQWCPQLEIHF